MLSKADFRKHFHRMLQERFPRLQEASEIHKEQLQDFIRDVRDRLGHRYLRSYADSYPGILMAYLKHAGYILSQEVIGWLQSFRSRRVT